MTDYQSTADKLNRKLHDLRVSVTDRCNFRCGYCMPKDVFGKGYQFLKNSELLGYDEIERLVQIFAGFGVEKIRLTGGEPLLRKDLEDLIASLSAIDSIQDIALTTNASLLTKARSESLRSAGIKRINISLDALDPAIYQKINQIPTPLEDVLNGVNNALDSGFDAVKINMVVQKGVNDSDILPMVERFRGSGAILRFIEFMDVGNYNQWSMDQVFTSRDIVARIHERFPLEEWDPNYQGEVAKRWAYQDGAGEIGVISSITQPFCGDCSRARLSAIGELYTCLFATEGFDLRSLLRNGCSNSELSEKISAIWTKRDDRYSQLRLSDDPADRLVRTSQKVEMSYIGG